MAQSRLDCSCRASVELAPQIVGGGQEQGRRSGTENVAGVIGMVALQHADALRKTEAHRLAGLRDELQNVFLAALPSAVVSGHAKHRLAGHLHISFPGIDAERLVFGLEIVVCW